ncbi:MAG: ATP-binding cassette domain-containing protein, partial [Myxococcota bacterium]
VGVTPVFQVCSLRVAADSRALLTGVELALSAGERVALSGPSGAGKTTLLRILAGLTDCAASAPSPTGDSPARADLRLAGRSPEEIGYPRWRRQVTYVAQLAVLIAGTVEDNLRLPFSYAAADTPYPAQRAADWLRQLGLPNALSRDARQLSEGEQQRVALCRSLLVSPRVALLDEPTSALDPESTGLVEALVEESCRQGMAALVVTHDPEQAARWCDRIIDLRPWMPAVSPRGSNAQP